jgi:hypothetical protein
MLIQKILYKANYFSEQIFFIIIYIQKYINILSFNLLAGFLKYLGKLAMEMVYSWIFPRTIALFAEIVKL